MFVNVPEKEDTMPRTLILAISLSLLLAPSLRAESPIPPAPAPAVAPAVQVLSLAEGAASPPAKISDIAWLSGYWQGEGLGGMCDEVWGKADGDRMHGFFSLSKAGSAVFSEAMMVVEEGGSLVVKIKHFGPDFKGWEEKDAFASFRLVRLGDQEAFFDGATYRRTGEDRLDIYVRIHQGDGSQEMVFSFKRVHF